jgi:3',5'-cyclic AMP phosphodiesterase CpdA
MIRLAHFSDIHITAWPLGWSWRDRFTKRYLGWVNFRWLGRRFRFRQADEVLRALMVDLKGRSVDRVVFSGDATALGFEAEFQRATDLLGLADSRALPGLAVPGNHDYYTRAVEAASLFERYFAPWQHGVRVDEAVYPFAQQVGPLWLVGVNSCTGNRWPWDAGGSVRASQLERLGRLLAQLDPGPRVLVTHYPVRLANGQPERRSHGLRDLADLVQVAADGGVCLWLHGHRHTPYFHLRTAEAPFPIVCAGSATQNGLWSYGEYVFDGRHFRAVRRTFDPAAGKFREGPAFGFELPERLDKAASRP